jgi:hypothetical protein
MPDSRWLDQKELTEKAAWKMSHGSTIKASICTEYEELLKGGQAAWTNWSKGRADTHRPGHRRNYVPRKLQDYAKSWTLLQEHCHECEVCRLVSEIKSHYSERALVHAFWPVETIPRRSLPSILGQPRGPVASGHNSSSVL